MIDPIFISNEEKSTPELLKTVLGKSYTIYEELFNMMESFTREWKFYSPKYGWSLKISTKKGVILFVTFKESILFWYFPA